MKKILFVFVFAIGFIVPIAMADVSTATLTFVSFYNDGVPVSGDIGYTINCYGYNSYPPDFVTYEEGEYTPELVYTYSASCAWDDEICTNDESYYMNYRHIDYCDVEGTVDGDTFSVSNFDNSPFAYCYDVTDENRSSYDEYTDQDYLERVCYEEIDITSEGGDYFSDISDSTYEEAIRYLKSEGIVDGYDDGTYKPDNTINRAEFLKIAMLSADQYLQTTDISFCETESLFSDVGFEAWYFPYVCDAVNRSIVSGYSDGSFKPGQEINFAEAAKMIVSAFEYDLPTLYDDLDIEWYYSYVSVLQDKNAIPRSIDSVDHLITRGEMAEVIYRLMTNYSSDYDSVQLVD